MSKCPSCNNDFVQPFVCTTCGAEKLRDEIMRALEQERDQLREQVNVLLEGSYAGVRMWVGNKRIKRNLTEIQIAHEREFGRALTYAAQYCLDALAATEPK